MKTEEYENIVIGSGQGGTPLALALAGRGERTALIEERHVGGTCVNTGCTPTKTLVASAGEAFQARRAGEYGVRAEGVTVDMERVRRRKREIVDSFRSGSEKRIQRTEPLELIRGRARFTGLHRLNIREGAEERSVTAKRIFIDTGSRPFVPPIEGIGEVPFLDNESVMELGSVPEHLIVLGGGYVGVEFAQMFRRFGSRVTVIQRNGQLLNQEDEDIAGAVLEIFREDGIEVLFRAEAVAVSGTAGGLRLTVKEEGGRRELEGSHLLVAAGRRPNTDGLGLEEIGVAVAEHGGIRVNERLETTAEGVWALGDVTGGPQFTHVSYDDYRVITRNLFGDGKGSTRDRLVPYTVFIDPQLGRVGLAERQARAQGLDIRVAKLPMSRVARALETGRTRGLMKAVVDAESERILGFAMLGLEGGEIAGAVEIAMMGGLPYTALRDGIFSHPTLLEALNNLFSSFSGERGS